MPIDAGDKTKKQAIDYNSSTMILESIIRQTNLESMPRGSQFFENVS